MPTEDVGELPDTEQGTTPAAAPELPTGVATAGSSGLSALLARCTASPAPGDCPPGLIGRTIAPAGAAGPSRIPTVVRLRYVTQLGPGIWQIVFETPEASSPAVWVWPADAEGRVAGGTIEPALLAGQPVQVATVTADPSQSFTFVITTAGGDQQATSEVGSVIVP